MDIVWTIVSVVVSVLVGVGFSVIGLSPPEFRLARFFFALSALILAATDVTWHLKTARSFWWQVSVGILVWTAICIGLPRLWVWLGRREQAFLSGQREEAKPKPPVHKNEWRLLAKEFDALPRRISVSYVYRTSDGHGESEWRQISSKLCTELCVRGGLMLLNSSHLKDELCRKTPKETDPRRLWLQCLNEAGALQYHGDPLRIPLGDGKFEDHLNGSIPNVAEHSAVLCHTCSNLQFRQESLDNG